MERHIQYMMRRLKEENYKGRTLHAFGDSYTFGYDLSDCPPDSEEYSKLTYSALFAEHYNMNYKCHAYGFSANNGILRQIKEANIKHNDLCFIMWSYSTRYSLMFNDGYYSLEYDNRKHRWWWDNVDQHPEQCFDRTQDSILSAQAILDKIGCEYTFLFNNIELQDQIQYNSNYIHQHKCLFLPKDHIMINSHTSHPGDEIHNDVFNILKETI